MTDNERLAIIAAILLAGSTEASYSEITSAIRTARRIFLELGGSNGNG